MGKIWSSWLAAHLSGYQQQNLFQFIGDLSRVQELEDFGELEKTLQEALEE